MPRAWRRAGPVERSAPVEMRFVDMFMAALGALVFLAMLLAFLLRFVPAAPTPSSGSPVAPVASKLELATKQIPKAMVGEPYDFSLAYRGGTAPVHWELAAGAKEFGNGMSFDADAGSLRGVPSHTGRISFVVRIWDANNTSAERAYDLAADESPKRRHRLDTVLAVIMLGGLSLCAMLSLAGAAAQTNLVRRLRDAYGMGERSLAIPVGLGVTEQVELPDGIATYEARARFLSRLSKVLILVLLTLSAWFAFRLWLSS